MSPNITCCGPSIEPPQQAILIRIKRKNNFLLWPSFTATPVSGAVLKRGTTNVLMQKILNLSQNDHKTLILSAAQSFTSIKKTLHSCVIEAYFIAILMSSTLQYTLHKLLVVDISLGIFLSLNDLVNLFICHLVSKTCEYMSEFS